MDDIAAEIQKIIDANERLIEQASATTFDKICKEQGADPVRVRKAVATLSDDKIKAQVQEEMDLELRDMKIEVEAEAEKRGLKQRSSAGISRRMGRMRI